ncbi:Predicted nucleotidyltransferase [Maribacter orientalis]|uniref:Predicted nucleotidyltransferase n=1 Tax=Maribacter orientalis TaxID=228957 RepID=A0A1H7LX21_9FLAO|nr:nucleotidyl transferase AbiEii/AbiGii toxin family protein [Maribacter orientalis]SEL03530.1 Predicted nucleotidyltransferase [Maribacter orientalis]
MNISHKSFKIYSFSQHTEVYLILERVFASNGINYYLIGANARDVALYKAGAKPSRATADIDFAVMVPDHASFEALKKEIKQHGFVDTKVQMPYRLFHTKSNTVIDFLPYGQIAQDHTVSFTERQIALSTVGMTEVASATEVFKHPEGFSIPVSPSHGLVILKLIAWSEKPSRTKDLGDIAALLESAWPLYEPELFVEDSAYADLFDAEEFETSTAAAEVMGRKMQEVLQLNDALRINILSMFETELANEIGPISIAIATAMDRNIEFAQNILKAIHKGITQNHRL